MNKLFEKNSYQNESREKPVQYWALDGKERQITNEKILFWQCMQPAEAEISREVLSRKLAHSQTNRWLCTSPR